MPTYRGNRGNLLQHWVLTQLVALLRQMLPTGARLCFIDAHAMSPFAIRSENPGLTGHEFDVVSTHLPGQGTEYEHAWAAMRSHRIEYPSSALFVRHLWPGPAHLVLCETDEATADEIAEWLDEPQQDTSWELHRGDWRARFREPFPVMGIAAYLISFDPFMFDRHGPSAQPRPGNMWPSDILRIGTMVLDLAPAPVVLQLSTYSANNGNGQDNVIESINSILPRAGLERAATIRAAGNMMTLVFTREFPDLGPLDENFAKWREGAG